MINICVWVGTPGALARKFYTFKSAAAADRFVSRALNTGLDGLTVWYVHREGPEQARHQT